MLRRSVLIGSLAVLFILSALLKTAHTQALSAGLPKTSLSAVKPAILNATGYEPAAVALTATKVQFVVTPVNSKLSSGPASRRESEASRIADAIAGVIAELPEYKGIQAIHIDYVSRKSDSSASWIIDGIDFRKDPRDKFRHRIT